MYAIRSYYVISKSDSVLDTVKLDDHNRFAYKINDLQPGFYTFRHGSEIQKVLLEPNDSIMFRLNTYDFDESLVVITSYSIHYTKLYEFGDQ